MGMTVTLKTKILIWSVPRSATRVRSGSLIYPRIIVVNSVYFPQRPGESCSRRCTNGARTSVEVRGGEDVSHRRG